MDGRLGDDPQPALAAEDHLADAGPGRGRRDRPDDERPTRGNHPEPPYQVGDISIPVRLHARGARRDPAPQRRIGERIREVAEGVATDLQLLLQPRSEDPGLDSCQPRAGVELEHAVEPRQVDGQHRTGLSRRSLQRAGDRRSPAEGDHDGIQVDGRTQDRGDLLLVTRPDHRVRNPGELTAALQDEVADRFAASVDDAVARVERHVHVADSSGQRVAQECRQARLGNPKILEARWGHPWSANIETDRIGDVRRQSRLVLVRESIALETPAPPLHRAHAAYLPAGR